MSNTVAVRYRSYLPGSGFDSNGSPVQGKQQVVGVITVTSAVAGESLPPSKIGLSTIDHIDLQVQQAVGGQNSQARLALYEYGAQEFYLFEHSGTALATTNLIGDNVTVRFSAFGDSTFNAEFL